MKRKIKAGLILFFLFMSIQLCKAQEKVFYGTDTKKANLELYFIPNAINDPNLSSNLYPFKIGNTKIIKKIIKEWEFHTIETNNKIIAHYIEISKNNETYIGRWISNDFSVIASKFYHKFSKEELFKYKEYFEPIVAYDVIINNIDDARKFINIAKDKGGYLLFRNGNMLYEWEEYSGNMELSCKNDYIKHCTELNDIEDYINIDFKSLAKTKVTLLNSHQTDSTFLINLTAEKNITELIAEKYTITKEWKPFENIFITISNLSDEELLQLAGDNGIKIDLVETLSFF